MCALKVLIGRRLQISLVGNFMSLELYLSWMTISSTELIVGLFTGLFDPFIV